ncbi:hypothetical protein CCAX7_38620 [Capsulimonas corticalis]|uniref:Uncharacterized protein n=1 Tax=Capsulimonas corticalis TaxID=2219043 RepID=A0A9N7QEY4_9BACT|nr:hypothetical protein CCAX7_38620 [Capsulimonas corticalis]
MRAGIGSLAGSIFLPLTTRRTASLTTRRTASLTTRRTASLTTRRTASLTTRRTASLTTRRTASLTTRRTASLTTRRTASLTTRRTASLTTRRTASLTTRRTASLTTRRTASLTTRRTASLTTRRTASLTTRRTASLTTRRTASLTGVGAVVLPGSGPLRSCGVAAESAGRVCRHLSGRCGSRSPGAVLRTAGRLRRWRLRGRRLRVGDILIFTRTRRPAVVHVRIPCPDDKWRARTWKIRGLLALRLDRFMDRRTRRRALRHTAPLVIASRLARRLGLACGFAAHVGQFPHLFAVHLDLMQMLMAHKLLDLRQLVFRQRRPGRDLHILGERDVQVRRQVELLPRFGAPHLDALEDDIGLRLFFFLRVCGGSVRGCGFVILGVGLRVGV